MLKVFNVHCFGAGRAGQYDGHCTGIERGDDSCGQGGGIDSGGEGESQVANGAVAEVGGDGRRFGVQELVHREQRGVRWLPVNRRDVRAFEALNQLVNRGGRHCGG